MTAISPNGTPAAPADTSVHSVLAAIRPLVEAVGGTFVTAGEAEPSDVALVWEGTPLAAVRLPALHGALDRLIEGVERDLGEQLVHLSREGKQSAIRLLDQRGAFILRRAVEDVADAMGVSRITVYNYLNAIHR